MALARKTNTGQFALVGPKFEAKGTFLLRCRYQMEIYIKIWPSVKDRKGYDIPDPPAHLSDEQKTQWEAAVAKISTILGSDRNAKDRLRWLKRVEEHFPLSDEPFPLLTCTPERVQHALMKALKQDNVTEPSKAVTHLRLAFSAIGRVHPYGDKSDIFKDRDLCTGLIGDTGNPVPDNMLSSVREALHRDASNEGDEGNEGGEGNANDDWNKKGYPVPFPIVYVTILSLLAQVLEQVKTEARTTNTNTLGNVRNKCKTLIALIISMHEGCRPIEITNYLGHDNIFLDLHDKITVLTLAFISAETLAHLLKNFLLRRFVMVMPKTKQKATRSDKAAGRKEAWELAKKVPRSKACMPPHCNSVDMLVLLTIVFRILAAFCPEFYLDAAKRGRMFPPGGRAIQTTLKSFIMSAIVLPILWAFYAIRYAAAEEDKKANIALEWTKSRMGHTDLSRLAEEHYAESDFQRVCDANGEPLKLGVDTGVDIWNIRGIRIEHVPHHGSAFNPSFLADKEAMQQELSETEKKVRMLLGSKGVLEEGEWVSWDDMKNKGRAQRVSEMFEDFSKIPFGMDIRFPEGTLSEEAKTLWDETKQKLEEIFEGVSRKRDDLIPEVGTWPQVIYGDWSSLVNMPNKYLAPPPKPKPAKKTATLKAKGVVMKKKAAKAKEVAQPLVEEPNADEPMDDFQMFRRNEIQPGDHVVILIPEEGGDEWALPLPRTNRKVWYAKAKNPPFNKKDGFRGVFLSNEEESLMLPFTKKHHDVVYMEDESILAIYDEGGEEITDDNLKEMLEVFEKVNR